MRNTIILFLLAIPLLLTQCSKDDPVEPGSPNIPEGRQTATTKDLGTANQVFGMDLFHEVLDHAEAGENIVVSPLSVQAAMLMALNGADKETYEAVTNGLRTSEYTEETLNKAYLELVTSLDAADQTTDISIANAVFWDQNRMFPADPFLMRMEQTFNAGREAMDFRAQESLDAINEWVSDHTQGKIDKILDNINPEEVMFLINALYFNGDWSNPFPEESTYDQPFYLSDGSEVDVPTMSHDAVFSQFKGEDFHAVDLHLGDSAFAMTFILPPDENTTIDQVMSEINPDRLTQLYDQQLQANRIMIYLPRFELEYKQKLNDALKALGMELAFDPFNANFTRLGDAPEGNLYISRVEHKSYLKVDEKGVEGAAVTSVGIGVTSLPPVYRFNRPFGIILRDVTHGSILFIGKVENPSG